MILLNSCRGAGAPVAKSVIHSMNVHPPDLVYFIGTAAILSMVSWPGFLSDRGHDTKAHAQNAYQGPGVRSLRSLILSQGGQLSVRRSLHHATMQCLSITQSGTFVVLVAREALFAIEEGPFHQRSSDSTRAAANRTRYFIPFSDKINHFVQLWPWHSSNPLSRAFCLSAPELNHGPLLSRFLL